MGLPRKPISFLATSRSQKAKKFYSDILCLTLLEETQFALVFADGEHQLRIQIVENFSPASHTVHGWEVTDIEEEIEDLVRAGVEFMQFGELEQTSSGVWKTPGGNMIAWFKDPSGNILSLTQFV